MYALIDSQKQAHSIRRLCEVHGVSRSNYYASKTRTACRERVDAPVIADIKSIHNTRFQRSYGSPRITAELRDMGHVIGRKRVRRLMKMAGISAVCKRRFKKTTDSKHDNPIANNVLNRDFSVGKPQQRWVADITYLDTQTSGLYLAAVMDLGTRKWVGFAVDTHMQASLCERALNMAMTEEGGAPTLAHTDRGSQYTGEDYTTLLEAHGITSSMSSKANCWDNAAQESFFGTFKSEVGDTFIDLADAKRNIFDYWCFYNRKRRHSALGYMSPIEFEKRLDVEAELVHF